MLRQLLSMMGVGGLLPSTLPPTVTFLIKLAWESKVRLPVLIAVAFMLTDYHLQLEINVDVHFREEEQVENNAQNAIPDNNEDVADVEIFLEGIIAEEVIEEEEDDEIDDSSENDELVEILLSRLDSRIDRLSDLVDAVEED